MIEICRFFLPEKESLVDNLDFLKCTDTWTENYWVDLIDSKHRWQHIVRLLSISKSSIVILSVNVHEVDLSQLYSLSRGLKSNWNFYK